MNTNNIAVKVENLEKKFGNFIAVNRINFEVSKGEIFGFLGPNGAGKSTTIRMLCGILMPTSGKGTVIGFDIMRQQEEIKQHIGYMSQKFSLYDDLTVGENIDFYGGIYKVPNINIRKEEVLKEARLENARNRLTATLAGGWKQRLALVCSLMHHPKMVFLDEPTSGVDPITRRSFWDTIKNLAKSGVTVFVTTHYMDEAENCNRMALIYKGNIIALGTPNEMKTKLMKDHILEIKVSNSEVWAEKLRSLEVVKETALFGSSIHAVVKDASLAKLAIEEFFKKEKVKDYSINEILPSLEDVFVSAIENYDLEHKNEHKKN